MYSQDQKFVPSCFSIRVEFLNRSFSQDNSLYKKRAIIIGFYHIIGHIMQET